MDVQEVGASIRGDGKTIKWLQPASVRKLLIFCEKNFNYFFAPTLATLAKNGTKSSCSQAYSPSVHIHGDNTQLMYDHGHSRIFCRSRYDICANVETYTIFVHLAQV